MSQLKKLSFIPLLIGLFFLSISQICAEKQLEIKYTDSKCNLSQSECNNTPGCIYIEEYSCGIVNPWDYSYSCEYMSKATSETKLVTGYFYDGILTSVSYQSDEVTNDSVKAIVNESLIDEMGGHYNCDEKYCNSIYYYYCPDVLYYSSSDAYVESGDVYDTLVYPFSTAKKDKYDIEFKLLKKQGSNGIMGFALLPDKYEDLFNPEFNIPARDPIECHYNFTINNYPRDITITYHNSSSVTATWSGLIENHLFNQVNTDFIKSSEYFQNWECPPKNKVYAYLDDDTLYISYNKEDLGEQDNIFEYEGDEPDTTPDPGDAVYGCDVIPEEIRNWIKSTLNLIKYIALVLVIVLGILDFIKAAASGEADQMKKSGSSFLKRIIAVVILFLLPVIVELVLNLIEIYGADSVCLPE